MSFGANGTNVIAGRPGSGKTTLMLSMLLNQADLYPDKSFAFFSYEVAEHDLETKCIMNLAGIEADGSANYEYYKSYFRDQLSGTEGIDQAYAKFWKLVGDRRIIILSMMSTPIDGLCSTMLRLNSDLDIGAFYVDYIQKIKIDKAGRSLSRQVQIQEISAQLNDTANSIQVPLIVGAQLNRASENRKDKEPYLSDMRESGDIEQDAATALILFDKDDTPQKNTVLLKVAKNRYGAMTSKPIELHFDRVCSKISQKEKVFG